MYIVFSPILLLMLHLFIDGYSLSNGFFFVVVVVFLMFFVCFLLLLFFVVFLQYSNPGPLVYIL